MTEASNRELLKLVSLISEEVSGMLSLAEWSCWARAFRSGSSSKQAAQEAALVAHQRCGCCEPGSRGEQLSLAAAAVSWAVVHAMEDREDLAQRAASVAVYLARLRVDSRAPPLLQTPRYA